VDVEDRETSWVRAQATCVEGEVEALMSRELISALRIIPLLWTCCLALRG